jgi:hypothetical protein
VPNRGIVGSKFRIALGIARPHTDAGKDEQKDGDGDRKRFFIHYLPLRKIIYA